MLGVRPGPHQDLHGLGLDLLGSQQSTQPLWGRGASRHCLALTSSLGHWGPPPESKKWAHSGFFS